MGDRPRREKKNFSKAEIEILLQEVSTSRQKLFNSVTSGYTATNKGDIWKDNALFVNAVSVEEVKKMV